MRNDRGQGRIIVPLADATDADPAIILSLGQRAIATEAEALWTLSELDQSFVEAIDLLRRTPGRVIVCGLGKSGHIASKLAATFRATGTPSCFLHANDAVHGDLGIMMPGDALLILSNSGDTREFGVIIRWAAQLSVPIIAMTSSADSAVASAAQILLLLPAKPEACPFGSSPTTSTTMMLALGDALAVTLLQLRGWTAADLHNLHPGGRLGLDLTRVDEFMHRGDTLPLVPEDMPMADALACITDKGFGVAGVIDHDHRLLGVITDGDIRRNIERLDRSTASTVMTRRARTLISSAMARDALAIMSENRITSIFVLADELGGRVVGLVHIHDLLRLGIG
jgi:arabinose-5-phosphate isomerase